jgi:hypothetical protein
MTRLTLALLAACAVGGCVTSRTPRPIAPVIDEVLPATPDVVYAAALKAVGDEGLPLRFHDVATAQIETEYVDIATYAPGESIQYPTPERLVRFRVVAVQNPQGPGTRLSIFALYQPFRTDYSDSERNARSIPRDHPGMTVARKLVERIKKAVGGE